jgi:hypothetical protein
MKIWIFTYFIFVRKIYKKRVEERSSLANTLGMMLIVMNIITLSFILEIIIPEIFGFINLLNSTDFPLAPIVLLSGWILLPFYLIFRKKIRSEKNYKLIRESYLRSVHIKRIHAMIYLILSIFLFISFLFLDIIIHLE